MNIFLVRMAEPSSSSMSRSPRAPLKKVAHAPARRTRRDHEPTVARGEVRPPRRRSEAHVHARHEGGERGDVRRAEGGPHPRQRCPNVRRSIDRPSRRVVVASLVSSPSVVRERDRDRGSRTPPPRAAERPRGRTLARSNVRGSDERSLDDRASERAIDGTPSLTLRPPLSRARPPRQLHRDPEVVFSGYQVPHPSDNRIVIKVRAASAQSLGFLFLSAVRTRDPLALTARPPPSRPQVHTTKNSSPMQAMTEAVDCLRTEITDISQKFVDEVDSFRANQQ